MKTSLYFEVSADKWPIVYADIYNIGFMGMEKLHPFDSGKWGRVYNFLRGKPSLYLCWKFFKVNIRSFLFLEAKMLDDKKVVHPLEATKEDLLFVHTNSYLKSLNVKLDDCN